MDSRRAELLVRLNRLTLGLIAVAGLTTGFVGSITDVPWVTKNIMSILLLELSARSSIWITDAATNVRVREYFDSLWQAAEARTLRTADGVRETTFEQIRRELAV